jgi:putative tricarboxylic transport membrane protein
METFELLAQGLLAAMQLQNLVYALIGVTLGTAVGLIRPVR